MRWGIWLLILLLPACTKPAADDAGCRLPEICHGHHHHHQSRHHWLEPEHER